MTDRLLTLQEAADLLKVHYMTAYRWVRRGDLPAFKAGGRLRVRASDLDRFLGDRQVDVALPAADPGRTDWDTHVARLHALLVDGAAVDAGSLVRKVVADGAAAGDVYLYLLTPALHRIGDDWEADRINVAVEHRATEIALALLARLSDHFRRRGPSRGTAVTLTPPSEGHAVAATMVADFLRASGYDVHHLGCDVPVADLHRFLDAVPSHVVCVSVTNRDTPPGTYADLVAAAADDARVVVGGQGADPDRVAAAGAEHVDDLESLATRLEEPARTGR